MSRPHQLELDLTIELAEIRAAVAAYMATAHDMAALDRVLATARSYLAGRELERAIDAGIPWEPEL